MNKSQQLETVLEYLLRICDENDMRRSLDNCKSLLFSAHIKAQKVFVEEDWGTVYQRDVLIQGKRLRFYPTIYHTNNIPTGWEWAWNTVSFVTNDVKTASNGLSVEEVEKLKIRSGFYNLWRIQDERCNNTLF